MPFFCRGAGGGGGLFGFFVKTRAAVRFLLFYPRRVGGGTFPWAFPGGAWLLMGPFSSDEHALGFVVKKKKKIKKKKTKGGLARKLG